MAIIGNNAIIGSQWQWNDLYEARAETAGYTPVSNEVLTEFGLYGNSSVDKQFRVFVFRDDTKAIVASTVITFENNTPQWWTATGLEVVLLAGIKYRIGFAEESAGIAFLQRANLVGGYYQSSSVPMPDPWDDFSIYDREFSFYASTEVPLTPVVTDITDPLVTGSTGTLSGAGFGATQGTGGITQSGLAVTETAWNDLSVDFTPVDIETTSLKYGPQTFELTKDGGGSDTIIGNVAPATGFDYVDLGTPLASSGNRIQTTPDLALGDQIRYGNILYDGVTPTAYTVSVNSDASFEIGNGPVPVGSYTFEVRVWDAIDQTWGTAQDQTVDILASVKDVVATTYTFTGLVRSTLSSKNKDGTALTSNFIKQDDIVNFQDNVILGAKGVAANQGWYEAMYTQSQNGGRDPLDSINYIEYDPGYAVLKQIDYFDAQDNPPTDYDQTRWYEYATAFKTLLIDDYATSTNYAMAGRFRYSEGLKEMYLRKQANPGLALPTVTQTNLQRLRDDVAYSTMTEFTNPSQYPWANLERVTSLYIQCAVDAEKCGVARSNPELDIIIDSFRKKLVEKINQTTNYIGSYTRLDTMGVINYNDAPVQMKPWMMGLGVKAITDFYDWEVSNGRGSDTRVVDIPELVYDYLEWLRNTSVVVSGSNPDSPALGQRVYVESHATNTTYNKTVDSFRYVDRNEPGDLQADSITPDLNNLVAYGYFWLARHYKDTDKTKAQNCLDWGEKIWLGCLYQSATRPMGEFFSHRQIGEQLRWPIDCLEIRAEIT